MPTNRRSVLTAAKAWKTPAACVCDSRPAGAKPSTCSSVNASVLSRWRRLTEPDDAFPARGGKGRSPDGLWSKRHLHLLQGDSCRFSSPSAEQVESAINLKMKTNTMPRVCQAAQRRQCPLGLQPLRRATQPVELDKEHRRNAPLSQSR